jgi:hypothetical protein
VIAGRSTAGARRLAAGSRPLRRRARYPLLGVGCLVLTLTPVHAQAPIANAKIQTRSAAQGLERELQAIAATKAATWIGYRLPAAAGSRRTCSSGSRVLLESPTEFIVLARLEAGQVGQLRVITPECDVDAGGMPLAWLSDVQASESVAWLARFATTTAESRDGMSRLIRPALRAIAMHAGEGAAKLVEIARTAPSSNIRRQAMARLGESHDPRALKLFEEILTRK